MNCEYHCVEVAENITEDTAGWSRQNTHHPVTPVQRVMPSNNRTVQLLNHQKDERISLVSDVITMQSMQWVTTHYKFEKQSDMTGVIRPHIALSFYKPVGLN